MDDLDLVAVQQLAHIVGQFLHHLVLAGHHGGQVQGHLAGLDAVVGQMVLGQVKVLAGIQQRLAGDAPHVEAHAAQTGLFFHAGHFQAELGRPHGRHVSAGTGADDHQVELCFLCHLRPPMHPFRVFDEFLDALQKGDRPLAVHDAVVVAERHVHHGSDDDLVVDHHRTLFDLVHAQNTALGHVQDGRAEQGAVDPAVADREGAAFQVGQFQPVLLDLGHIVHDGLFHLGETQALGMADHRHHQSPLGAHGHADVLVVVIDDVPAVDKGVDFGKLLEGFHAGLDEKGHEAQAKRRGAWQRSPCRGSRWPWPGLMSISLKVVSMAVFCLAASSRSAIRWRMGLMGLRSSVAAGTPLSTRTAAASDSSGMPAGAFSR